VFIDLRPANDHARGHIPAALSAPGASIRDRTDELPEQGERVVVYDADGHGDSGEIAAWLRERGWGEARRLQGGFEAWERGGDAVEVGSDASMG